MELEKVVVSELNSVYLSFFTVSLIEGSSFVETDNILSKI